MKRLLLLSLLSVFLISSTAKAEIISSYTVSADSINLNAEISLWFEYHKNSDFESAMKHAWTILEVQPSFTKYKFYPKFEEMLWAKYEKEGISDEEKKIIADTLLFVYDKAIENDESRSAYYYSKKGYVLEVWLGAEPSVVIPLYEKAIELDSELDSFYKDRLGQLYVTTEEKLKALDLYSKLAEVDASNPLWNQRMEAVAENPEELVEITKKAWDLDKENLEKAWKYATNCLRIQDYEKVLEPLVFLTKKAPDVVNYWKQLSTAYDKLGKTDDAIKAYKQLITLQPDNKDNYVNLALIYKKIDQLSVSRSYLQKALNIDSGWDYPYYIEAQLYEQSARSCVSDKFEFIDKCVYQLAVETYRKAGRIGGAYSSTAMERVQMLSNSVPSQEDYFFRKIGSGEVIKIEGKCYDWIGKSITAP